MGELFSSEQGTAGDLYQFRVKVCSNRNPFGAGIATMPLELDWGKEGEIFEVTSGDFQKNSMEIFGYEYTNDRMKGLRDLFLNTQTFYGYRLNGGGKKACNELAEALYCGVRGNDLKIVVR